MKNPYRVEPTRFMKRKESRYAIECHPKYGPRFGSEENSCSDLLIDDNCNKKDSCHIDNDGTNAYKCHPRFKKSLYVDTDEPDETNFFTVLDYEVYTHH